MNNRTQEIDQTELQTEPQAELESNTSEQSLELVRAITIHRSPEELHSLWRNPHSQQQILEEYAELSDGGTERMHWRVHVPKGPTLEWETQIVEEHTGNFIRWVSLDNADVVNEGVLWFQPGPSEWGTEVRLRFRFDAPGGAVGKAVAKKLDFVPGEMMNKVLRRFKNLAETGEIPRTEPQPAARKDKD